jgi:hypothetical protein
MLDEVDEDDPESKRRHYTNLHSMVNAIIREAKRGNVHAFREITDRVEGKVAQAVEVSGPNQGPVQSITSEMTPAQAARAYQETLASDLPADEEPTTTEET